MDSWPPVPLILRQSLNVNLNTDIVSVEPRTSEGVEFDEVMLIDRGDPKCWNDNIASWLSRKVTHTYP